MTTVDEVLPPTESPPPQHISWSAIGDMIRCAKAYQLGRVLNLPPTPGYALAGGSAVHEATEMYDRLLFSTTGR